MQKQGRALVPTAVGLDLTTFLSAFFTTYVDYDFTSDMERRLDKVSSESPLLLPGPCSCHRRQHCDAAVAAATVATALTPSCPAGIDRSACVARLPGGGADGDLEWRAVLEEFWGPFQEACGGVQDVTLTAVYDYLDEVCGVVRFAWVRVRLPLRLVC